MNNHLHAVIFVELNAINMFKYFAFLSILFSTDFLSAQTLITEPVKQKINTEVEIASLNFRAAMSKEESSNNLYVQFAMDTFRIERTMEKMMEVDYSTHGMLDAMNEAMASYDKLLNKYYQLILNTLNPTDKPTLITAQKAWLQYRNAEEKLIVKINSDSYTGGGTMYLLRLQSTLLDRLQKRVLELYLHYSDMKNP